ncbi:MAG: 1-acyl-sn-glycerol-3-phosphate acyltransferase [Spirochaetia bacterium]|nr:1-acyl-sn-glycerol-3-phosphate acyltransferase [Spirochaetia bacterium]
MFESNSYTTVDRLSVPAGRLSFLKKFRFYKIFIKMVFRARKGAIDGKGTGYIASVCENVITLCESVGGKVQIEGLDNLRKVPGSVVIAANHMSTLETIMFPAILEGIKEQTYVVKRSLVEGRIFGPVMRLYDPIALDRKEPRVDLMKVLADGTAALQTGKSVVLFPQGTRMKDFDPTTFNSLAVKLAKRAGVPVVPCAIKTDFWENGKAVSTIGDIYPERTIHFSFGEPVVIDGAGKKEQSQIVGYIDTMFKGWLQENK